MKYEPLLHLKMKLLKVLFCFACLILLLSCSTNDEKDWEREYEIEETARIVELEK